jgi:hypothetical protein
VPEPTASGKEDEIMNNTRSSRVRAKDGTASSKRSFLVLLIVWGLMLGGCAGNHASRTEYQGVYMPPYPGPASQVDLPSYVQCQNRNLEKANADESGFTAVVFLLDGAFEILDWIFGNGDYKSACNY